MPKKTGVAKNTAADVAQANKFGGVLFCSSDDYLEAVQDVVNLPHVTKPWTREAWERARPWILEQRQKLESLGWHTTDANRTELYVLKRNAPHGADTEDGSLYLRIPKKFVDFMRSGRDDGERKRRVVSKKKDVSYALDNDWIWKVKIDGEGPDSDHDPNVQLDGPEAMENIFYLVQCLQPGIARLHAEKKDVIQRGTLEKQVRDDLEHPTARYRGMVAQSESYTRTLPPTYWLIRNAEMLENILGVGYQATLNAAENDQCAITRSVKGVEDKVWEGPLTPHELAVIMEAREKARLAEEKELAKKAKAHKKKTGGKRRMSTTSNTSTVTADHNINNSINNNNFRPNLEPIS